MNSSTSMNSSTAMNSSSSSAASMYSLYGNAGLSWPLVACALALNAISIPGMLMNFFVVWVTYRVKFLHGTANYLLGLCSFFEMVHQSAHLLFLYMAVSGHNFLPYGLSVRICSAGIFCLGGISPSMAFTGLDRLLCVLVPTFPKRVKPRPYLGAITAVCLAACALMLTNTLANDVDQSTMITGFMGEIVLVGRAGQLYSSVSFALLNVTMCIYVAVGVVVKLRTKASQNNSVEDQQQRAGRRLFRALCLIIGFNVGGYYLMRLFQLFFASSIGSPSALYFTKQVLGLPLNASAASNAPILFLTSKEYRRAFTFEFHRLCKLVGLKQKEESSNKPPAAGLSMVSSITRTRNINQQRQLFVPTSGKGKTLPMVS